MSKARRILGVALTLLAGLSFTAFGDGNPFAVAPRIALVDEKGEVLAPAAMKFG